MHFAVLSQNYKLVRNLLIRKAKTDMVDIKGDTPLNIAINRDSKEIISLLVINK